MENSSAIVFVHNGGTLKTHNERKTDVASKDGKDCASVRTTESVQKGEALKTHNEGKTDVARSKDGKDCASVRTAASVLAERNFENAANGNAANKMVSPVLLKLRRNQERKVTPANRVDPVQVPPKHFRGFPADRYMSPTDSIMSPVSRGLLARNRRSTKLPPVIGSSKDLDCKFQNTAATDDTPC